MRPIPWQLHEFALDQQLYSLLVIWDRFQETTALEECRGDRCAQAAYLPRSTPPGMS